MSIEPPTAVAPWLRRSMLALCCLLIALQAADGLSTHLALSTGLAEEKNEFILTIARTLEWPVIETVFAAKILTGGIFGIAMLKTKASIPIVVILAILAAYLCKTVLLNFYWAWLL